MRRRKRREMLAFISICPEFEVQEGRAVPMVETRARVKATTAAVGTKAGAAKAAKPAKADASAPVRPKKLYRKEDASKENVENGKKDVVPDSSRRALQKRAIEAGIKATGKNADIKAALAALDQAAGKGFDAYLKPIKIDNKWEAANDGKAAEREELADLAFLGIKGTTPGGRRWRSRMSAKMNEKPIMAPMAPVEESAIEVA
jgi:hypothetical protein